MAYDEELADRLREALQEVDGVTEKRMFGGLAFLVHGNVAVAASSKGGLMLRVDPAENDALLREPHTSPMVMSGRPTDGWLRVGAEALDDDYVLTAWGRDYSDVPPLKGVIFTESTKSTLKVAVDVVRI